MKYQQTLGVLGLLGLCSLNIASMGKCGILYRYQIGLRFLTYLTDCIVEVDLVRRLSSFAA